MAASSKIYVHGDDINQLLFWKQPKAQNMSFELNISYDVINMRREHVLSRWRSGFEELFGSIGRDNLDVDLLLLIFELIYLGTRHNETKTFQ